jgi:phosphoglycerate dehydrogenase-like enzyme
MAGRILVTPRSVTRDGHPALEALREAGYELVFSQAGELPGEEELVRLVPGCVGYLAGVERITRKVLAAADALRVISRNGVGGDNIDMTAATESSIRVCLAEGANARGVAELALGLMLALARALPYSDAGLKQGRWERRQGTELEGRTLGLVGCGRIGKLVAGFALALGMRVRAHDVAADRAFSPAGDFAYVALEHLLAEADFVSLHCPSSKGSPPLIDSVALSRMKQGAYLINTARAGLLDEQAVLAALDSNHLAGVAVDVFDPEPPGDSALVKHDRVIATPHIGGYTEESVSRATSAAVENLLQHLG